MQRLQHVVGQENPIMKVRLTNVLNANKAILLAYYRCIVMPQN